MFVKLFKYSNLRAYIPGEGEAPSGATAETVNGEDPVKENQIALAVAVWTSNVQ